MTAIEVGADNSLPLAMPSIRKHLVRLVYPFRFEPQRGTCGEIDDDLCFVSGSAANLRLGDLAARLPLPIAVRNSLLGDTTKVWVKDDRGRFMPSEDFFPHIRRILTGDAGDGRIVVPAVGSSSRLIGVAPLKLGSEAINALSGAHGKRGAGLTVKVNSAAQRRISPAGDPIQITFTIDDGFLHLFGTGVGCVVLCLGYHPVGRGQELSAQILVEANYACSRTGDMARETNPVTWVDGDGGEASATPAEVAMDDIVRALCPFLEVSTGRATPTPLNWQRIFTYTVAVLDGEVGVPGACASLAFRLSRKYTDDYLPDAAELARHEIAPFENVTHMLSLEGGCVLVELRYQPDKKGELKALPFLDNFITDSAAQAYWPLALLAYQEFEAMLWITQGGGRVVDYEDPSHDDMNWMKVHQCNLLCFRQNFRFASVSRTTMHNRVYDKWREVLMLDKLLAEATQDVHEVTQFLNRRTDEALVRLNIKQTRLGMIVGATILISGIFGMNIFKFEGPALDWRHVLATVISVLAVAVAGMHFYKNDAMRVLHGRKQNETQPTDVPNKF